MSQDSAGSFKKQSSALKSGRHEILILWNLSQKDIPLRSDDPENYPEDDERHWYDMEYAGWHATKAPMPQQKSDGPAGKLVICLQPALDTYQQEYFKGMKESAEAAGVTLRTLFANWNKEVQGEQLMRAIDARPDLIVLNPEAAEESTPWYRMIYEAGIPVIASNFQPVGASFKYLLAWTGPDDWGQSRMLAHTFAEYMHSRGGYVIFRHIRGSSSYYARTFGVITELRHIAPDMSCISVEDSELDEGRAYEMMTRLLETHGRRVHGVVCADDTGTLTGINRAVAKLGREDIKRVSFGSTGAGLNSIRGGRLHALAYQSPKIDGALAMKVAIDWFAGLEVQPISYLPKHIVTEKDVDDFLDPRFSISGINLEKLYEAVENCQEKGVYDFFENIYIKFLDAQIIREEEFRGFSIETLSNLLSIIKRNNVSERDLIGNYEDLYKKLFMQRSLEKTLEWMRGLALDIITCVLNKRRKQTLIQKIIGEIDENCMEKVSLKVLSCKYSISSIYLGQLFKKELKKTFSQYINERRIDMAKKLFRTTSLKGNEIALKVGYSNPNYFYNIFKRYAGMYPSEYIQAIKDMSTYELP